MKKIFVLVLIIVFKQLLFSQSEQPDSTSIHKPDTLAVRGIDWLAYPYIFYSPETSLAFGGGGIVFLAIVGGAAESFSAIAMAQKNKMDLSVGILLGSCIQITLFVATVLVLLSLVVGPEPLHLSFPRSQIGALFFAVIIGSLISGDGRSNWFKGVQLIAIYIIIALMFFFIPDAV